MLLIAAVLAGALTLQQPMRCNVPLTGTPPTASQIAHDNRRATTGQPANALALLYTGGEMQIPYTLQATMTLPRSTTNKGLFYSNWVLLASRDSRSFVQIELMRWKKFNYRNEIALTWAEPDGVLRYYDTPVFVSDAAHELSISLDGDYITLQADNSVTCAAGVRFFYASSERLYYQIGSEVSEPGDRPTGEIWNIRAGDAAHPLQAIEPRCSYRGFGLSLEKRGSGRYVPQGVFDAGRAPVMSAPCDLKGFAQRGGAPAGRT